MNQTCVWNITAEEGHFILLDFDQFELEKPQPSGMCVFDYVSFDGGRFPCSQFPFGLDVWTRSCLPLFQLETGFQFN